MGVTLLRTIHVTFVPGICKCFHFFCVLFSNCPAIPGMVDVLYGFFLVFGWPDTDLRSAQSWLWLWITQPVTFMCQKLLKHYRYWSFLYCMEKFIFFWFYQSVWFKGKINPLTPGTFCQKCIFLTFWWFWGWISAKLALIWSKMHLWHDS